MGVRQRLAMSFGRPWRLPMGVIPAQAGIQWRNRSPAARRYRVPACAGLTPGGTPRHGSVALAAGSNA